MAAEEASDTLLLAIEDLFQRPGSYSTVIAIRIAGARARRNFAKQINHTSGIVGGGLLCRSQSIIE